MEQTEETPTAAGSRALRNEKHERFCLLILKGKTRNDAYRLIGNKSNTSNAKRLLAQEDVQDRIAWLRDERAKAQVYDSAWIKDRLARHAEHLTEVIVDEDGTKRPGPMFNPSAGARSLELLGKEHGMFKEKIELGGKVGVQNTEVFERMTPEERAMMRTMLTVAAARAGKPANSNEEAQADEADHPGGVVPAAG